jgi:hypothetical protein
MDEAKIDRETGEHKGKRGIRISGHQQNENIMNFLNILPNAKLFGSVSDALQSFD